MVPQRWIARVAFIVALPVSLQADTLILRDGSRVQGELIAVRNGTIEFEERRNFGAGRTLRFDRDEVVRIEFETYRNNTSGSSNNLERPTGMREKQVIVSADVSWNDTGIDVRPGQTVYFESLEHRR